MSKTKASSQKEAEGQVSMEKSCLWQRLQQAGHGLRRCFLTELLWILTRENVVELGLKEELVVEDN